MARAVTPGGDSAAVLAQLLKRRLVFVAGKGGTGKTTLTAALALLAARAGKRVLCIEVDAKGDLPRALGSDPVGFEPRSVQPGIAVLALHAEESLQEYLRIYFKVPRLARMTPLSRVFDFIATGVPGTKDMLIVGKVAYEEKRREKDGRPVWDLILVDSAASGHVLPQLGAARSMLSVLRGGGIIRSQVEWIDATLQDRRRTLLTICALPEEMPVAEAIELHDRAQADGHIGLGACFLNRTFPVAVSGRQEALAAALAAPEGPLAAEGVEGGAALADGVHLARVLADASRRRSRQLRSALDIPVLEVPYATGARPGLATSRAVAVALETVP
ncbi:MAG: ArsA-related P-loop ATPase [Candidatus Dormibacteria bacterium]